MVDQTGSELERAQVCDFVGALILRRARDRDVRRSPRRPEGVQGRDRQGADAQGDDGDAARGRRDDDPQGEDDGGQVIPLRPPLLPCPHKRCKLLESLCI